MEDFNSVLYSLIGEKLKNLRIDKNLSQTELSDKIDNIGRTSISNIEKGKQQPPLHVIYLICNELDVDIHEILPTYAHIFSKVESPDKNDLFKYLDNKNIDEKTLKALTELFKLKP